MASVLSTNGKNLLLDALAAADYISLHTADPGLTGANEVTGGSPAYARKALTWSSAANGTKSISNQPVFDVPATTVAYVGLWSAVTGGTYYGHWDPADEVYTAQGTYTVASGSVTLT